MKGRELKKLEVGAGKEVVNLRHAVSAVLLVNEHIVKIALIFEKVPDYALGVLPPHQPVRVRQSLHCGACVPYLERGIVDAAVDEPHELLARVYGQPTRSAVQHQTHGALRCQHATQGFDTALWRGQVVKDTGTAHQIERCRIQRCEVQYR